jgi:hypothetical protein
MKEQLITFETAVLAKEKGFNISCFDYYNPKYNTTVRGIEYDSDRDVEWDWNNNSTSKIASPYPNTEIKGQCSAPTQSLLQKWLREEHLWYCNVELNENGDYIAVVTSIIKNQSVTWDEGFNSFEEALEFSLQEALKLIK